MPLTETFLITTDSGLNTEANGFIDATHKTDESDNPQTFIRYFGSQNASRSLKTSTNPGVDNITITPTDILPEWEANTAYVLGERVQPTGGGNGFVYECTTAGTSHATTEPTWNTSINSTNSDGTVIWTLVSTKHEITEVELSDDGSTWGSPGAALSLGNTIDGGVGNLKEIHIRVNNNVNIVGNNIAVPEIGFVINGVTEY